MWQLLGMDATIIVHMCRKGTLWRSVAGGVGRRECGYQDLYITGVYHSNLQYYIRINNIL